MMSRELLKLIAMAAMLMDHLGMMGLAGAHYALLRAIGRLAFPLFAFQVAVGWGRTRSKKRYLCTMAVFALVSEIPYNLIYHAAFFPQSQSVMVTFCIALVALLFMERFPVFVPAKGGKKPPAVLHSGHLAICGLLALVAYGLGEFCAVEYGGVGVLLVVVAYGILSLPKNVHTYYKIGLLGLAIVICAMVTGGVTVTAQGLEWSRQMFAALAILPIGAYLLTGEKKTLYGKAGRVFQYFGYGFYPLHILALLLIVNC